MTNSISRQGDSIADYRYTVVFEPIPEGGYHVVFPCIPEIVTFGHSLDEARRAAQEALRCHIERLLQDGDWIPVESRAMWEPIVETVALSI